MPVPPTATTSQANSHTKGDDRKSSHSSKHRSRSRESKSSPKEHRKEHHHKKEEPKYIDTITVTQSTVGIIVPAGATFVEILLIGGGGGGGASGDDVVNIPKFGGGGGGGGGTYKNCNFCVKGGTIDVKIGAGGLLGATPGANGQDGGDTTLTYKCFTKEAHGGMGGGGSFNGSLGGKGGEGEGLGDNGDDGYTNINSIVPGANQLGGAGGLSGLCESSPYGNGGYGQDQETVVIVAVQPFAKLPSKPNMIGMPGRGPFVKPGLSFGGGPFGSGTFIPHARTSGTAIPESKVEIITTPATVTPVIARPMTQPSIAPQISQVRSLVAPLSIHVTPACAPATTCATTTSTCCRTSCSTSPTIYNTSNNGTPGYCRLVFFSSCDGDSSTCPDNRYRKIVVKDPTSFYLIDPNTSLTEVDTTNFPVNLSLGRPRKKYKKVTIKLAYQNGLNAYVMPISGGTFLISSTNPSLTLVYEHCVWAIADNTENVYSYYPTTQQGNDLIPFDFVGTGGFEIPRVAVSADGNTFIFGDPNDDGGLGAAWIYVRRNGIWSRRAKLIGNDYVGTDVHQGHAVAISADGNTVAFGGYNDNSGQGAVWVFTQINCNWIQQGPKLVNPLGAAPYGLGVSVDLSADGNTLIAGEPDTPSGGGAIIFNRALSVWSLTTYLVGAPGAPGDFQGISVSISADATEAAVGSSNGTVWMFSQIAGVWSQDGPPLTGPLFSAFGNSLALASNGLTLAVGMPLYASFQGGVTIFNKIGGIWVQQGLPLYVPSIPLPTYQGLNVDLSGDGNTLAFTGVTFTNPAGITWIFNRVDDNWVPAQKLVNGVVTDYSLDGMDVSLSSDASTLVTAKYSLNNGSGIAVVYI